MMSSGEALVSLSRGLRVSFFIIKMTCLAVVFMTSGQKSWGTTGSISRVGDATHIEFEGQKEWNYDLNRQGQKQVSILVPAFDQATELKLKSWSDSLVEDIEIKKEAPDGRYEVIFTLAGPEVESFDYLTDEPSRLIIDFYKQAVQTAEVPEVEAPQPKKAKKSTAQNVERGKKVGEYVQLKSSGGRDPAGGEILEVFQQKEMDQPEDRGFPLRGVFDGGDPSFDRFRIKSYEIDENSIIANRQNIYIKFPYLKMPVSEIEKMMANSPEYAIKEKNTKENKEARLLLHLSKKDRDGAFLKTYNYFINKYPNSVYDEIVRNLAAEHHFKKYRKTGDVNDFQRAEKAYSYLLNKYPDSPLAERTHLLMAYAYLERGEALPIIQTFKDFLAKHPKSDSRDKAKNALAQAYLRINKYEDARNTYLDLIANGLTDESKVEATYRIGDVHVAEGNHAKAVEAYKTALKTYPEFEKTYPNAHYNLGESMFWMPQYQESLEHFVKFLERFPSHDFGGYAMTRIGELLEILGADQSKVMGAFLESYFRFKNSPGAKIARIRMLSQRMKGMKDQELRDSLKELDTIVEESQMPRIAEFVNLMVADGYHRRGEYDKSLDYLISYYQKNPTSTDLSFFKKRILRNISDGLVGRVEKGDYLDALKFNSSYQKTWLKNQDRMDIPYYVGRAYEQAGVFDEAKRAYEQILTRLEKIQNTQEGRERRVNEHLPSIDEVHLRLAKVDSQLRDYAKAQDHLAKVKSFENLSPDEKVEMVQVQAVVSEERGQLDKAKMALSELTKVWEGKPEELVSTYLKLGQLQLKTKEELKAEKAADKVIEIAQQDKVEFDELKTAYEIKGDAQLAQGKELAAVETFSRLLDMAKEQQQSDLASIRFKAGNVLYSRGDYKGANNLWEGIDAEKNPLFSQMAQEKMEHANWQNEYKKYIQRIPAMSGMKQEQ